MRWERWEFRAGRRWIPSPFSRSRNRLIGTLAGALLSLVIVAIVPPAAAIAMGLASLYLFMCYIFAGKYALAVVFLTTTTTILLASGGLAAAAVRLGEYRVALTFAAIAAAGIGMTVSYADRKRPAARARRDAAAP